MVGLLMKRLCLLGLSGFLFFFSCNDTSTPNITIPEDAQISEVILPAGYDHSLVQTSKVDVPSPGSIPAGYKQIGAAYDIRYNQQDSTDFGAEFAEIRYDVDWSIISQGNYLEDFQGFYFDEVQQSYRPVYSTWVDEANQQVVLYTDHFTIFIITVLLPAADNVHEAPDCIDQAIAENYLNSGQVLDPDFILVDENFEYYRDRNYTLRPWTDSGAANYSSENQRFFEDLSLRGALGIATYNGGSAAYPTNRHKTYTGQNYISFTAAQDLDLYLMYDCRGGGSRFNFANDASWLTSQGFQVLRDGQNDPYFVQTTDAVGYYTVYHRRYSAGEEVALQGNRNGTTDTRINTNYWAMVRPVNIPQGDNGFNSLIPQDQRPPGVSNLTARPDNGSIQLEWLLPTDTSGIDRILIRRSTLEPPQTPYQGEQPGELTSTETSFSDGTAPLNQMVYYTVFTLTADEVPSYGKSVGILSDGTTAEYPPSVLATSPGAGASAVNPDGDITITFSQDMDASSLTSMRVYLERNGSVVSSTLSYSPADRSLTLDPQQSLERATSYYLVIKKDVQSTQGRTMGGDWIARFTTSQSTLDIDIIVDIPQMEGVTITGFTPRIQEADSLDLHAQLDAPQGGEVYRWFLNGAPAMDGQSYSISGLDRGHYRVDLLVYRGNQPVSGYSDILEVVQ